jgi:hypothetical protein
MSAGSNAGRRAPIRSSVTSYGLYGGCSVSRSPGHRSCSLRSAALHSAPLGSLAWSNGLALRPSSGSRAIRTCCAMPAATRWLTKGTIHEPCRPTLGIEIFSTRFATPNYRRRGSRIFGELDTSAKSLGDIGQSHSMTSSAVASSTGGTERPSASAVLRLITRSNLSGRCIGKSLGLAPCRTLAT